MVASFNGSPLHEKVHNDRIVLSKVAMAGLQEVLPHRRWKRLLQEMRTNVLSRRRRCPENPSAKNK
jgi:hypothetical protein